MRTVICAVAALLLSAGGGYCETYTLEAYYPSPVGAYTNVTVTSSTVLARDGGAVTVGGAANPANLSVRGDASVTGKVHAVGKITSDGVVVPGSRTSDPGDAASKIEGAIYYNTGTHKHRVFSDGAWKDLAPEMLLASETPCTEALNGKKALALHFTFPGYIFPTFVATVSHGMEGNESSANITLITKTCTYGHNRHGSVYLWSWAWTPTVVFPW